MDYNKQDRDTFSPQSAQTRPPCLSPLQAGDGGQGSQRDCYNNIEIFVLFVFFVVLF
jgi:hypothetical protein